MKTHVMDRLIADPTFAICLTDFEGMITGGPHGDREVEDLKIHHWRSVAANRGNDFIDDRQKAEFPKDPEFEVFVDDLSNEALAMFTRPYHPEVPGCREEVLRQISVLDRDPRPNAVANALLSTCMQVFEYCSYLPPHPEWN